MNIAIIGASGFIGSGLEEALNQPYGHRAGQPPGTARIPAGTAG